MSTHSSSAKLNPTRSLQLLREDQIAPESPLLTYENEGSDRLSRGSVTVASGGWWSGSLEVRMGADQGALLTITRSGAGVGPAPTDASLVIPPGEADALLTLLTGLVAHARADGVLEQSAQAKPRRKTKSTAHPEAPPATG
jgi:hypothetical protein